MNHSDAYCAGYNAFKRNLPRHANPASAPRFDAIEWDLGWEAAKIDADYDLDSSPPRLSDVMGS